MPKCVLVLAHHGDTAVYDNSCGIVSVTPEYGDSCNIVHVCVGETVDLPKRDLVLTHNGSQCVMTAVCMTG